jgi:hypothetical protein
MDADALLHPRGPLPPGVYWRRRVVTLVAVVLVLFLLSRSCGSDGSPAGLAPSATPSAPVTTTQAPKPTKAAQPPASATASPTASVAPGAPCRTADLVVNARASAQTYAAGQRPVLTIGVANKGSVPCTFDVGQANREIRVVRGGTRVWSSDDCSPGGAPEVRTLEPGAAPVTTSVTWARKGSSPGCPAGAQEVPAGYYRVIGRFGQVQSEPDTFQLS